MLKKKSSTLHHLKIFCLHVIQIYKNGVHGDVSKTYLIGAVDEKVRQLVEVTEKCLYAGIAQCRPGQKFLAIGTAIR